MIYRLIIFLALNFGALAIGSKFTSKGVPSDWYLGLAKAPWTPPGWVFGAAWTVIMICFAVYMVFIWQKAKNKKLLIALYALQWILNVSWNPVFFYYHNVFAGLLIISGLTILIGFMLFFDWHSTKLKYTLLLPYFIWLLIATSLNGYILVNN